MQQLDCPHVHGAAYNWQEKGIDMHLSRMVAVEVDGEVQTHFVAATRCSVPQYGQPSAPPTTHTWIPMLAEPY